MISATSGRACTHAQRIEVAIQQSEKMHPGFRKYVEKERVHPVAEHAAWAEGCAASWTEELYARYFKTVQAPAGNHHHDRRPDQPSTGLVIGAMHSAFHAIADIDRRERERSVTQRSA